ncbi:hypothetical protein DOLIC_00004 [Dolichomitus sp. PSUC_FEM 10030005]|nr:hypothetical protein [Dolichomitus sp. PSUC_FEM 10030005]
MAIRRPPHWPTAFIARTLGNDPEIIKKYEQKTQLLNTAICKRLILLGSPNHIKRVINTNEALRKRVRSRMQRLNARNGFIVRHLQTLARQVSKDAFTVINGTNYNSIINQLTKKTALLRARIEAIKVKLLHSRNEGANDNLMLRMVEYIKTNMDFRNVIFDRYADLLNQAYESIDAMRSGLLKDEQLNKKINEMSYAELFKTLMDIMDYDINKKNQEIDPNFVHKLCTYALVVHSDLHKLNIFHLVVANIAALYNTETKNQITLYDNITPLAWPQSYVRETDITVDATLEEEELEEENEHGDADINPTLVIDTLDLSPETTFYKLQQYLLWSPIAPRNNYIDN